MNPRIKTKIRKLISKMERDGAMESDIYHEIDSMDELSLIPETEHLQYMRYAREFMGEKQSRFDRMMANG